MVPGSDKPAGQVVGVAGHQRQAPGLGGLDQQTACVVVGVEIGHGRNLIPASAVALLDRLHFLPQRVEERFGLNPVRPHGGEGPQAAASTPPVNSNVKSKDASPLRARMMRA